jgi:hypothetical protein
LAFFASSIFFLSVVGAINNFSSIPYWDMWDGVFNFYFQAKNGNIDIWWSQHNEHRIVLSRLLFWIDIYVFKGLNYFLIAFNYLLVIFSIVIFKAFLKNARKESIEFSSSAVLLFITSLLFLWVQKDNLSWGFQSQFFLAQSIPLCGIFFLAKSTESTSIKLNFVLALFLGTLAYGTMANGVLTLPMYFVYALYLRQSKLKLFLLLLFSCSLLFLYFHNYHSVSQHGSFIKALIDTPLGLLKFVITYLGNPWNFLFNPSIGFISGVLFFSLVALKTFKIISGKEKNVYVIALIFFIFYIIASATGTAGGRLIFGIDKANTSRYSTPVLMAWCALLIIYLYELAYFKSRYNRPFKYFFIFLCIFMFIKQTNALRSDKETLFSHNVALLALALEVDDQEYLNQIYPNSGHILNLGKEMVSNNISILSEPKWKNLSNSLNNHVDLPSHVCNGTLTTLLPTNGNSKFVRINGLMELDHQVPDKSLITILDDQNKVLGFGILKPTQSNSFKFIAYALKNHQILNIAYFSKTQSCYFKVAKPSEVNFSLNTQKPILTDDLLNSSAIIEMKSFDGQDFDKTSIEGISVYGSYVQGDADTGYIDLSLNSQFGFYYKTGPSVRNQWIEIKDLPIPPINLVRADSWTFIKFDNPNLPNKITVRISDKGAGWGEWSAIAVRKNQ